MEKSACLAYYGTIMAVDLPFFRLSRGWRWSAPDCDGVGLGFQNDAQLR
jgi:hypothetical protein